MASLAILLILLPLSLLALVGVILLVLGIVQRRNALWITGIVLMALSFVPAILMAAGMYFWTAPIQSVQMPATAPQPITISAAGARSPRRHSGDIINELAMPAGTASVESGMVGGTEMVTHRTVVLSTPKAFDAYLANRWQPDPDGPPPGIALTARDMWTEPALKDLPFWRTSYPLHDGAVVDAYLWYDAKANKAYCVTAERPEEP
jgi:hypothetical protein